MGQRNTIAETFLAAAVEPERWLGALQLLAESTGSDHAQIIGIGRDYSIDFNWVSGMTPEEHAKSDRIELVAPTTNFRVAAGMTASPSAILREDRYEAVKPLLTDDAYLDLCSDLRIPHGCQTTLRSDDGGLIGFALLRSHLSGPTTVEAYETFADLRGAAVAATALQVALEREGHKLLAGGFDVMGTACFVFDRTMTVRAITAPAELLLGQGALRLSDGRLGAPDAVHDRRLGAAFSAVEAGRALAGTVAIPDGPGMMVCKLHRLPVREWSMGFAPFAIMVVKRSGGAGTVDLSLLRDTYGLTVSEAEIALLLRAGQARDSICIARGITRETLRSHLRSLFAKLGVSRETEAIHLLHALLN